MKFLLLVVALLATGVWADIYLHNMRGSNNRLNEQSATRNNGDRLFDSQNNNRGGYNVGDRTDAAFNGGNPTGGLTPAQVLDPSVNTAAQYQMAFYEGSQLHLEWTNQHGCGGNEKNDTQKMNCNMVIQYACDQTIDGILDVEIKDGGNTNTPGEPNALNDGTKANNDNNQNGRHESENWYYTCKTRLRNKGLFHADQNLNGNTARYTRQNNNGNRRGLECPEERDYFPYWVPTPWRDIAYLTDSPALNDANEPDICPYIRATSHNNNNVYRCLNSAANTAPTNGQLQAITQADCTAASGSWSPFKYNLPAPICAPSEWSRDNHLGNGRNGESNSFDWTLPSWSELNAVNTKVYTGPSGVSMAKCVLRVRYNISTDDYDPWNTNSTHDNNPNQGIISPITNNPTVDVGAHLQGLRLAINTNQFGRTFQDRSHVFYVVKRPQALVGRNIVNLNVRGKRGNIVQTYPGIEYDFVPNRLSLAPTDWVHVQWTGSNTHNNGANGGDGQTGDAGEGTTGTDRSNMLQYQNPGDNYPIALDKATNNMWKNGKCMTPFANTNLSWTDCALWMATSGKVRSATSTDTTDVLLNNAPASLHGGLLLQFGSGTWHYACTRNNNFSNRSQKGTIVVA